LLRKEVAMARAFSVLCCLIVGLQLLVGVPLIVCLAFFAIHGGLGPIALEVHTGPTHAPPMLVHGPTIPPPPAPTPIPALPVTLPLTLSPPPNIIPPAPPAPPAPENPILQTRAEQGSPLDGTILTQNSSPNVERDLFVAALEKVASEATSQAVTPIASAATACPAAVKSPCCTASADNRAAYGNVEADRIVLQRLYEIAEIDERSGNYERADQWRALARDVRRGQTSSPPPASELDGTQSAGPALVSP
jgi:hypothetical protein